MGTDDFLKDIILKGLNFVKIKSIAPKLEVIRTHWLNHAFIR